MKQVYAAFFCLIVLMSCHHSPKSVKNDEKMSSNGHYSNGETFESVIRPGEKLQIGKIYTDHFEYTGYNDDGDYFFFNLKKGNQDITLIDGCEENPLPTLNIGDELEIQWKIDSTWVAGDNDALQMTELAVDIKKIKNGKVSLFREKYPQVLKYYYDGELGLTASTLDRIYREVEYYIANSKQELVLAALNDSSNIGYSIEKQKYKGKLFYLIGIYDESNHQANIFQWLYLSEDLQQIYEYDLPNDQLVLFN